MDDTTPSVDQTDNSATQDNWEQRYLGLQKVVAKRDSDLNTRSAELDSLRAEKEALNSQLAEYLQQQVDASEEDAARIQYEALRDRFEPEPLRPVGNNPARTKDWFEQESSVRTLFEPDDRDAGFPT